MGKSLLLISVFVMIFSSLAFGQIVTTIADVQDTTGGAGGGASHLADSTVTVNGVISAEIWAYGSSYFIQDGTGPWSGIMVYDWGRENAYGDSVQITAEVSEYYGLTELTNVTSYVKLDSGKTVEPTVVTTGEIGTGGSNAEAYEGVLVRVNNVTITNPNLGYGEWEMDDGSGACMVDDKADYYFDPANYDSVRSITGPLDYSYSNTKMWPRLAWDIVEAGMPSGAFGNPIKQFTRIQRFQQVRYSDLLKTPIDEMSDMSYASDPTNSNNNYAGDTLHIRGIVTYPTDLGSAGAGRKMILTEIGGGPWSSVLSYHPDASLFPALYEGDIVEMYGYVGEYRRGPSNMTEFWILTLPEVTDFGQPLPVADTVTTGDLRLPVTAEQWGNVMVVVKDAEVTDLNPAYAMFSVDDGTGSVDLDADSDSLSGYPDPPLGSIASSIRGWMYHHYGLYTDSTAYKLCPPYTWDFVWGGGGPPILDNAQRDIAVPTSTDVVTVSVDITAALSLVDVSLYYKVDGGTYTQVAMANTTGDTYAGQIPANSLGSWVDYFISVTDDSAQTTIVPTDTSISNLCYPVTDGSLTISDIQYTPWELADSPFDGYDVTVTGIVTTDTASNNNYLAYGLQDAEAQWSGLFVFGIGDDLNRGDQITVQGTVTEHNPDWDSKWGNNTVILNNSYSVVNSGNTMNSMSLTTGELADNSADAESYEGTLVTVTNVTLDSVNSYDVWFNDGSGPCLVDDDFISGSYFRVDYTGQYLYAFGDTIRPGDVVAAIRGVYTWSFGSYKISVRDANDFGAVVGVDPDYDPIPLSYKLNQNYPNPFNPETRIYFEIPKQHKIKIVIYNVLGQVVRTLTDEQFDAGRHIVNWDGLDNNGKQVSTGVYIYRIKAGQFISAKKMMLMK